MPDDPENVILVLLRRLDTKVDRLDTKVDLMGAELATVKSEVRSHGRMLNVLQQDVRLIRAAVNDIARVDVTSGEVEALHHDVNRLQQEVSELAVRIEIMESRDRT